MSQRGPEAELSESQFLNIKASKGCRARHPIAARNSSMSQDLPIRITLVHGTWGRLIIQRPWRTGNNSPFWFDKQSPFSERLRSELQRKGLSTIITTFHWSGANSILHRDQGAEALAKHLIEERLSSPSSRQVVIAHKPEGLWSRIPSARYLIAASRAAAKSKSSSPWSSRMMPAQS